MSRRINLALWSLAVESAVLLSIPFLVPHSSVFSLVGFVPLFYLDKLLRENRKRHAFIYYYISFLLFNVLTTWWIWNISAVGAIAATVLNALQMAAVFALYRLCGNILERRAARRSGNQEVAKALALVFFAITWVAWEHIYFDLEVAWPWLVLGNAFATSAELVQWYEIFGTVGGSAWILICNILVFLALCSKDRGIRRFSAFAAAVFVFIPMICSLVRYNTYEESSDPFEAVVIQPNINPLEKYGVTPQAEIDRKLLQLAEARMTPKTKFIITPETYTYNINLSSPLNHASMLTYKEFLGKHPDTNLLLGALALKFYHSPIKPTRSARPASDGVWYDACNTALVMDSEKIYGDYIKSKLVPGVEIIPYEDKLRLLAKLIEISGGSSSSYATQERMEAIPSNCSQKAGAMICYESVFGNFSRDAVKDGATFMAVITNDGWWGDTPGYHQHFRYARLRAIEYRRDIVQAANTGTSGIINQRGDILYTTPWWVETSFRGTINGNTVLTPFVRHGDVVGRICSITFLPLMLILLIFCVSDRRHARGRSAKGKS